MSLYIVPCTLDDANSYVQLLHRHNKPVVGARICFAVADQYGNIRGVAIVGRPVSRLLDDGWTLEITRCCTDGHPNACSFLMANAWKAVRSIGYQRLVTYTLPEEGSASLKAVGWKSTLRKMGQQWSRLSRPREENALYLLDKYRWEVSIETELPFTSLTFPEDVPTSQMMLFESEEGAV